jgi:hypothetical protein
VARPGSEVVATEEGEAAVSFAGLGDWVIDRLLMISGPEKKSVKPPQVHVKGALPSRLCSRYAVSGSPRA